MQLAAALDSIIERRLSAALASTSAPAPAQPPDDAAAKQKQKRKGKRKGGGGDAPSAGSGSQQQDAGGGGGEEPLLGFRLFKRVPVGTPCSLPPPLPQPGEGGGADGQAQAQLPARPAQLPGRARLSDAASAAQLAALAVDGRALRQAALALRKRPKVALPAQGKVVERPHVPHDVRCAVLTAGAPSRSV